jgi:hypothetical protein
MKKLKLGLCAGRHDMPVDGYIFEDAVNPTDVIALEDKAIKRLKALFPFVEVSIGRMPNQADYTDVPVYIRGELDLYVTGLTTALVAVLNACRLLGVDVTLWHFDRDAEAYYSQWVV